MDEVLNRKLFRHRAQILHGKVQGLQLGGPPKSPFTLEGLRQSVAAYPGPKGASSLVGDLLSFSGPGRLYKGAKAGISAFQAARAARNLPPSRFTQYVGEPVSKAVSKFAEKYPRTTAGLGRAYGGAETLGGGALIAGGAYDVYEGMKDESPQEVGQGIASILAGRSLGRFGIPRLRGKELPQFSLKKDVGLPLGVGVGSEFLPEGAIAEERNLINNEIAAYESEIGRQLTDAERKKATLGLQEQIKAEKAKPLQTSTAEDLKFATGTVDSIDVFKNVVNANTQTVDNIKNNPGPRSDEEINATLEKPNIS